MMMMILLLLLFRLLLLSLIQLLRVIFSYYSAVAAYHDCSYVDEQHSAPHLEQ